MRSRIVATLAFVVIAFAGADSARAESGRLNLHLDLGAATPFLGPTVSDGTTTTLGGVGWLGLDYQIKPPVALEILGGFGGFNTPQPTSSRSWSPYGTAAVGARFRFLDNQEGYHNEQGGDYLGNFWISAHLGYHFFDGHQFGIDAGLGYEWSLVRPMQIGIFARGAILFGGDEPGADGIVAVGVNFSFELFGNVEGVDTDGDGLSDEREIQRFGTQANNPDTDGDGLPDGLEVTTGTDPLQPDTDGDGLRDGQEDGNADGFVGDGESDPRVEDTDGGGVPDGFEAQDGTDARDAADDDKDGDGVLNHLDQCRGTAEGTEVDERGCAVIRERMTLPGITFDFDSDHIRPESERTLRIALQILSDNPEAEVEIGGHTDNQGARGHNRDLSRRRAEAVKAWLVQHGVAAGRMSTRGYGPDRPVASNDTEEGRSQNRRIEFTHSNFAH